MVKWGRVRQCESALRTGDLSMTMDSPVLIERVGRWGYVRRLVRTRSVDDLPPCGNPMGAETRPAGVRGISRVRGERTLASVVGQ